MNKLEGGEINNKNKQWSWSITLTADEGIKGTVPKDSPFRQGSERAQAWKALQVNMIERTGNRKPSHDLFQQQRRNKATALIFQNENSNDAQIRQAHAHQKNAQTVTLMNINTNTLSISKANPTVSIDVCIWSWYR